MALTDRWTRGLVVAAVMSMFCGAAWADDLAQASEVEEITVTARKREERLQTAPLSVTALSGNMIAEKGIEDVVDIGEFAPNLNIHTNAGGNTGATINIRGAVTSDPIITLEPTVGVYVDGVYVAKSLGSLFDMADLERIEVLRGPQGTLYGRNTVGGAINLISRKPSDEFSATSTFSVGNFDSFRNVTTLNAPIVGEGASLQSDLFGTLNGRATIAYRVRDGFVDNTGSGGTELDNLNRFAGRAALRWQPLDTLMVDYTFDYHRSREEPTAFQLSGVRAGGPTDFLRPLVTNNRRDSIANNSVLNPDGSMQDLENDLEIRGHSVTVTADLGDLGAFGEVTLKSITGVRRMDQFEVQDLDGTANNIADFSLRARQNQISEEVQVIGTTGDARIDYVLGFYAFNENGAEHNPQVFFGGASAFVSDNNFNNASYAPFGQATYTPPILDDRLSVTMGMRYSFERKRSTRDYQCLVVAGTPCGAGSFKAAATKGFDKASPMGNIAFRFTEDVMGYARVSRGFKSGGFNGRAITPAKFTDSFEEETLTSGEFGFKSQWLDNRLRLNADGFFNNYDNMQVTVFTAGLGGAVTELQNAARAEIWGAEAEVSAVPVPGVAVRLSYSFLSPDYKKFIDPDLGDVSNQRDFVISPEHTFAAGVTYSAPPSDVGLLSFGLDLYWQDKVEFAVKDNDLDSQGGYALLNGRVQLAGIPTGYGDIDLAIWARNLFDKKYKDFGIDFGQLGYAGNTYGDPRTFGAEMVWRWDEEA